MTTWPVENKQIAQQETHRAINDEHATCMAWNVVKFKNIFYVI